MSQNMDLSLRISGDATQLNSEMGRTVSGVQRAVRTIGAAFGVGFAVRAIVRGTQAIMRHAEALNDAAAQAETNTTALQRLYEAGRQFSAGQRQIDTIMQRLLASRAQAIEGDERMASSFENLGISMRDLPFMSTEQMLQTIGASLRDTTSASREYAEALQVLGRRAGVVVPMLRELGQQGLESFEPPRMISEEDLESIDRARKRMEGWRGSLMAFGARGFGAFENYFSGSIEGEEFDNRVEERIDELIKLHEDAGSRIRVSSARGIARDQIRAEMAREKQATEQQAIEEAKAAAERARIDEEERRRREEMAALIEEAMDIEERARIARLSDAERLIEVERELGQLRVDYEKELDDIASARMGVRMAELQLIQQTLQDREAERQRREQEDNERRAEREAADRDRQRQEFERIRSGEGVTGAAPGPADFLASIGGFVGSQTHHMQGIMERQLRVNQRMEEFLKRIEANTREAAATGVVA